MSISVELLPKKITKPKEQEEDPEQIRKDIEDREQTWKEISTNKT